MSESTLQITFTELETEIGRYLGWHRTKGNWSANQVADNVVIQKRGLRQFYFPPRSKDQIARNEQAHRWTFLRPRATLDIWDDLIEDDAITATASYADPVSTVTASAAAFYPSMEEKTLTFVTTGNTYVIDGYTSSTVVTVTGDASAETGVITIDSEDIFTLPWDYGGMTGDGRFKYDESENRLNYIEVTSDVRIGHLRQASLATGTPYLAAIIPLTTAGAQGQRWGALFHPPPNDVLTLHYRYYVLADALVDTSAEYPYGSVPHSETILESCLAIAEMREKDSASTVHQDRFLELLQGSIDHDRMLGEAIQTYGYNRDMSDGVDGPRPELSRHYSLITHEGVEY
jgi:hypothetical protein